MHSRDFLLFCLSDRAPYGLHCMLNEQYACPPAKATFGNKLPRTQLWNYSTQQRGDANHTQILNWKRGCSCKRATHKTLDRVPMAVMHRGGRKGERMEGHTWRIKSESVVTQRRKTILKVLKRNHYWAPRSGQGCYWAYRTKSHLAGRERLRLERAEHWG